MIKFVLIIVTIFAIQAKTRKIFDVDSEYLLNNLIKEEKDKYTIYRLTLSEISPHTNAEDFKIDLIGSEFLVISVNDNSTQWRIRLDNRVPNHLIFYPEYSVSLLSIYPKSSTWEVFVRIPKFYDLTPVTLKIDEL